MSETDNRSAARLISLPAVFALNRLRYFYKFLLIGVVVLIPFGFVTLLQYRAASKSIEFNAREADGIEYMTALQGMVEAQQRYWVLSAAVRAGVSELRDQAANASGDVQRAITTVDAADRAYGATFKTSAKWVAVKQAWDKAVSGSDAAAAGEAAKATAALFADVGNGSNLILDPDLDSYWLMDAVVGRLPTLGTNVATLTASALATTGPLKTDALVELAGIYKASLAAADDVKNVNIGTAIAETKNFGNNTNLVKLTSLAADLQSALGKLAAQVAAGYFSPAVGPDGAPVPPNRAAIAELATEVVKHVRALADAVNPELRSLIVRRVDNYASDQSTGLTIAIIAALVLIYVFIGFYVAVRGSVDYLRGATTRIIAGTTERFGGQAADEIGEIAESYNEINAAVVASRALQRQVQSENDETQRQIVDLLSVVSNASDGDLTVRATTTAGSLGNVADAFNLLLENLQELIAEVAKQVNTTTDAVQGIASTASNMATGAASQAHEMLGARSMVQSVATQLQDVSKTAVAAATTAQRTEASAVSGVKAVDAVVTGMDNLRASVQAGAKKMKTLGDRSMEITGIVNTISRISEQTNMLALNAAIEAARAGEHGLGFSVVADEVRKLAERSAAATKDIELLVKTIHAETSETVQTVEQQAAVVEHEASAVSSAGDSLRQIQQVSTEAASIVTRISSTATDQTAQVQQVSSTMERLSKIALETQRDAETTAGTAVELLKLSSHLTGSIARFKISGNARS